MAGRPYMSAGISIHAPLTGSDVPPVISWPDPRPFQSTLPLRGATALSPGGCGKFVYFNPRSPYGERPICRQGVQLSCQFQSTLPLRGATAADFDLACGSLISIHAPLTGSDCFVVDEAARTCDFNPRSPYGERLSALWPDS